MFQPWKRRKQAGPAVAEHWADVSRNTSGKVSLNVLLYINPDVLLLLIKTIHV